MHWWHDFFLFFLPSSFLSFFLSLSLSLSFFLSLSLSLSLTVFSTYFFTLIFTYHSLTIPWFWNFCSFASIYVFSLTSCIHFDVLTLGLFTVSNIHISHKPNCLKCFHLSLHLITFSSHFKLIASCSILNLLTLVLCLLAVAFSCGVLISLTFYVLNIFSLIISI